MSTKLRGEVPGGIYPVWSALASRQALHEYARGARDFRVRLSGPDSLAEGAELLFPSAFGTRARLKVVRFDPPRELDIARDAVFLGRPKGDAALELSLRLQPIDATRTEVALSAPYSGSAAGEAIKEGFSRLLHFLGTGAPAPFTCSRCRGEVPPGKEKVVRAAPYCRRCYWVLVLQGTGIAALAPAAAWLVFILRTRFKL